MRYRNVLFVILLTMVVLAAIKLSIPSGPPGFIRVKNPQVHLTLQYGWWWKNVPSGKEQAKIPSGMYRPKSIQLKEGSYTLSGDGFWGRLRPVMVRAGQTTELDPGSPLEARVEADIYGRQATIRLALVGKMQEQYDPWAETDGEALSVPRLNIYDEAGTLLHTDYFGFG